MPQIPREETLDSSLALLSEGYTFVSRRYERFRSDVFETRLMLRRAICMMGEEAALEFYVPGRFTRRGGLPMPGLMLLQDFGSALVMDGEAHRHRKAMLMSLMTPGEVGRMVDIFEATWRRYMEGWEGSGEIVLHGQVEEILCRTACAWAGVPLPEAEVRWRTREFVSMIEGAGAVGPRNWWGHVLRGRTEAWIRQVVKDVRSGELVAREDSPIHVVATHRDSDGNLLDVETAAVEVINLLRPTVAVARYVTFSALALHEHPGILDRRSADGGDHIRWFVQEVRRFYPFFPLVGGRVVEPFEWRDHEFEAGEWVLLDLYGTNHDPRTWDDPGVFHPERFRDWTGTPFGFIPQGGGDHLTGHRCAGEWLTIELTVRAVELLTGSMTYEVPPQDLEMKLSRMPAIPRSRFMISEVQAAG